MNGDFCFKEKITCITFSLVSVEFFNIASIQLFSLLQRIKSTQIQKLLREEKEVLTEKVATMNTRNAATEDVLRRYEEREKVLQTAVSNMEKEIVLRQQTMECHKRKAVEVGAQWQEMGF